MLGLFVFQFVFGSPNWPNCVSNWTQMYPMCPNGHNWQIGAKLGQNGPNGIPVTWWLLDTAWCQIWAWAP
jgi:hypothetical protein